MPTLTGVLIFLTLERRFLKGEMAQMIAEDIKRINEDIAYNKRLMKGFQDMVHKIDEILD